MIYLTVKQQLKHLSKDEFLSLRELSVFSGSTILEKETLIIFGQLPSE